MDEKGGTYETSVHFITRSCPADGSYHIEWITGFSTASEVSFQS
jgi:hypothetical protein